MLLDGSYQILKSAIQHSYKFIIREIKMYFTIYKTTNCINGKIYIGAHKTTNLTDNYIGSGNTFSKAKQKYGEENFIKEIIFRAVSEPIMYWIERMLVDEEFINLPYVYNEKVGGIGGWNSKNKLIVEDSCGNTQRVSINDERYLSGELVAFSKNKVTVKDKNGNTTRVSTDDNKFKSGELRGVNYQKTVVKDSNGIIFQISTNDERYLSGELKSVNSGFVIVKDGNNENQRVSINDERYLSGELKGVNIGKSVVKDKDGNVYRVDSNDKRILSGELVHLAKGKRYSQKKIICPFCKKEGGNSAMKRYHFENCKYK
jgi:hypothetical protein